MFDIDLCRAGDALFLKCFDTTLAKIDDVEVEDNRSVRLGNVGPSLNSRVAWET